MDLPLDTAPALLADDGGTGGLPVVFLHALGGTPAQWSPQLAHLRAQRRAVALALRGHAGSIASHGDDYAIEALAADVLRTLDTLSIERFALVGHSCGAHVALACAAAAPRRVAGLLLADPAGDLRRAPGSDSSAARAAPPTDIDDLLAALDADAFDAAMDRHYRGMLVGARAHVVQRVLADARATPRAVIVGVLRGELAFDPLEALDAYPGATLAVDTWLAGRPTSLRRLCPQLRATRLGDTSHWLQLDRPHEFNLILDGWLSALNPVRREAARPAAQ